MHNVCSTPDFAKSNGRAWRTSKTTAIGTRCVIKCTLRYTASIEKTNGPPPCSISSSRSRPLAPQSTRQRIPMHTFIVGEVPTSFQTVLSQFTALGKEVAITATCLDIQATNAAVHSGSTPSTSRPTQAPVITAVFKWHTELASAGCAGHRATARPAVDGLR
ncbi:glycoside hydrolase family 10 protein [Athelia psychrophila]|uniref:Glycoside hydrolase family 10 protein n=1 Tax=Athelia psychrophila TaxID=1759441 RepID=A0A166GXN1_9AGAM|nr:glycoside hydrolase family 10 protein [Fibularhizoctonia sp. CBS 109695]